MKLFNAFILIVAVMAAAVFASCSDDDKTEVYEADIISMLIDDDRVVTQPAVVDNATEITFIVSTEGEDLTFAPRIEVSEGAVVSPASGKAQSFSAGAVTYTVTAVDGTTKTYKVRCVRLESTEAHVKEVAVSGGDGCIEGDVVMEGPDIYFYVNYHSTPAQLKGIKISFTLASEKASIVPVDGEDPDFSQVESARYKSTAENQTVYVIYTVHRVTMPNSDAMITSFTLTGDSETDPILTAQPTLDASDRTLYFFTVKYRATDVQIDALESVIEVSDGATYAIKEGGNTDFSKGRVVYVVTAQDGQMTTEYKAEFRRDKNDEARILGVNTSGTIVSNPQVNEAAKSVMLGAASTITDEQIKAYRPEFVLSDNATVKTENPSEADYDYMGAGVKFVVTSEDGASKQTYTVKIDREARNSARIVSFTLVGDQAALMDGTATISDSGTDTETITLSLKSSAPKNKVKLSPVVAHSAGSSMTPASGAEVEFTYGVPVTYTVTAEDGTTVKKYEVTLTRKLNTEALLTDVSFTNNGTTENPNCEAIEFSDTGNRYITMYVKEALTISDLTALKLTMTISEGATVSPDPATINPATGTEYKFTVTAEDGTTKSNYTLKLMKRRIYNFDNWEETTGKYLFWSFKYWHPSDRWIGTNAKTDWGSANDGAGMLIVLKKYNEDYYPTVYTENGVNGTKAARLTTHRITGGGGPLNYPHLVPGSMFLGWFATDMNNNLNSTKFGIEFHGKPVRVTGKYKYTPGETFYAGEFEDTSGKVDGPAMTVVLYEVNDYEAEYLNGHNLTDIDTKNIVAMAQKRDYGATSSYADFELVPEYGQKGRVYDPSKKYKLAVVFSSSKDGDIFNGAHISELLIDDVVIYYE